MKRYKKPISILVVMGSEQLLAGSGMQSLGGGTSASGGTMGMEETDNDPGNGGNLSKGSFDSWED